MVALDGEVSGDLSAASIDAARHRIAGHVHRTPVLDVDGHRFGCGPPVSLKLEYLQPPGSFKARGAANNLLAREVPDVGVVAASGGNHGVAVAWAAQRFGHRAHIFVPEIASPAKVERLRAFGAVVHVEGVVYRDAQSAADRHRRDTAAMEVHPYNSPVTLSGAGTMAAEIDEQCPDVDTVLVACGGGGLAAGVGAWFGDRVRIVIVEGERTPTMHEALRAGRPVDVEVSGVTADALGASRVGELPFAVLAPLEPVSVLVSDDAVMAARADLWRELRIVSEPSAATTVAALLAGAYRPDPDERLAVVICGANTDVATLSATA